MSHPPHTFRLFSAFALCGLCSSLCAQSTTSARPLTPPPPRSTSSSPPRSVPAESSRSENSALLTASTLAALDDEAGSTTAEATTNNAGPVGIVPLRRGLNFSIGTTSQHDSAGGWSTLLTPNVAYRINRNFSLNAGIPVFGYTGIYGVISTKSATKTTAAVPMYGLAPAAFLLGDMYVATSFETHPAFFDYNLVVTVATPTGDDADGLGAGQVTYNFNNHFEKPFRQTITPDLEVGIGNSPNLVDRRVSKSYIDVGTNAHFQAGVNFQLPFDMSFTSDAFEELPITTQTVTSTTTNGKKGTQLKTITTSKEKSVGEDNGFINTLDIPLSAHVTMSGFYNRSLRNKIDTVGFSFTFLLKGPPRGKETIH